MQDQQLDDTDFADNPEMESAPDKLQQLGELSVRALQIEREIIDLTKELGDKLKSYNLILSENIPEVMSECRLKEFTLESGQKLSVQERFIGNQLTNEEGLAYVEEHDGSDLIKTVISVELPKGDTETAERIYNMLKADRAANRFVSCELTKYVHQSTIASFVKNQVEAGEQPPLDKLGVVRKVSAKIGRTSRIKTVDIKGFIEK